VTIFRPGSVETPSGSSDRGAPRPIPARTWWLVAVAGATVLGLAHALAVAPHYHVGSFDDDANYILAARALASGAGLTTKLRGVAPLVAVYPPGFPALLAPLALIWPHGVLPFRVLSLACFVALFPLTWVFLRTRKTDPLIALAVLLLLALNPVSATFATMVMAEMPFLVAFLVLLLLVPRWELQARALTWSGVATVLLAAGLIWLKEAGVGIAIGVVAWLVLRRLWRKAAVAAVGTSLLMTPVLIARAVAGVALIGSRYSTEIGGPYPGGMIGRIIHLPPSALATYLNPAIPNSIVPTNTSALPVYGPIRLLFAVLLWTAAPLVVIGFLVWVRRGRDVTCVVVPMYLLETLLFPDTNERRIILILPVILAWYALGGWTVLRPIVRAARAASRRSSSAAGMAAPVAAIVLVVGVLVGQFPRDYLFALGESSSAPGGSPYMSFLRAIGRPDEVVDSSYLWGTALFSGHRTADGAFNTPDCTTTEVVQALRSDDAAFLLSAALNQPKVPDGLCPLPRLVGQPGIVRLYRSQQDEASVFELIGPGTPHPALQDLAARSQLTSSASSIVEVPEPQQIYNLPDGSYPTTPAVAGQATLTWSWGPARPVSQISLSGASGRPSTTTSVMVELREPDGLWRRVMAATGPVGSSERTRYLLTSLSHPITATAVRVVVDAQGTVAVHDLNVLGPTS